MPNGPVDCHADAFLREAAGNPLALVELPIAYERLDGEDAGGIGWLPLTTRLEQAFAARALDLPVLTRIALIVAALSDGPTLSEVLAAAALVADPAATPPAPPAARALSVDVLVPAISAQLVEIDETQLRFRHPLIRTAIRQHASVYVDLAEKGYTVDITNRGRLVAQLIPVTEPGSPLERLIAAGIIEPAEEPGGVGDLEPYPSRRAQP